MIIEEYFHPCVDIIDDDEADYYEIKSLEELCDLPFVKKWLEKKGFAGWAYITRERWNEKQCIIVAGISDTDKDAIIWHNVAYILNGSQPSELKLDLVGELVEESIEALKQK